MGTAIPYAVNCGFAWFIVILAVVGYFLTIRRIGEKWPFWIILALGWAFFAILQALFLTEIIISTSFLIAIWLSSYILISASLVLLFLRLIKAKQ